MPKLSYYERAAEMLRRRNAGATWDELVRWSGWQRSSCESAVSYMRNGKLKMPTYKRPQRIWFKDADELIKLHWEKRNGAQISRILNRVCRMKTNAKMVNRRAWALGLRKPGKPSDWWSINVDGL